MERVASAGAVGGASNIVPDLGVSTRFHKCLLDHPEDRDARRAAFSSGLAGAVELVPDGWIDNCHRFCP
eukprot:6457074-Alexandrium_andersonii.AAC.1